jgi:hypothetical protein
VTYKPKHHRPETATEMARGFGWVLRAGDPFKPIYDPDGNLLRYVADLPPYVPKHMGPPEEEPSPSKD